MSHFVGTIDNTILLVEDEPADVELVRLAFRNECAEAKLQVVRDGEAAIQYLSGISPFEDRSRYPWPSLVLLDLKLPKVNGLEVLAHVKKQAMSRRIPIVVLSSSAQESDINEAYDRGANSYLVKPVIFSDYSSLAQRIRDFWISLNLPPEMD